MKSALFKIKYRFYRPKAFELLEDLKKSQYRTQEQWIEFISRKRNELVLRAFRETAFYARIYSEAGFQEGDAEHEGYFESLPALTKDQVKDFFDEFTNPSQREHIATSSTGGSTGVPTRFGYDRRFPFEAFFWRMLGWWGIGPWDHGAYLWRNPRTTLKTALNQMLWWPTMKLRLDASSMSERNIADFVQELNLIKPPLIQGYVGAVEELARYLLEKGGLAYVPQAVWATAAPLLSMQRKKIERAFNAPVYDQYGACEAPNIAAQCEQRGGLHVNQEWISLEFVDEKNREVQTGEWGRTLVTKFDDFVFPLIRYEVGDVGRFLGESCGCGKTLPLIDGVKGRLTDIIRLPSGRVLSGEYLTTIFDSYPDAVSGFRVIHKKDTGLAVEYVCADETENESVLGAVKSTLEEKVGHEVPVILTRVESITHDRGKLRVVVRED